MTGNCAGHNAIRGQSRTVRYCADGEGCNRVTTPVTQMVPGEVTNPAPHHTTPHHTTKNYSQPDHGTGGRGWQATQAMRDIPAVDTLAAAVCLIRPDWNHAAVRAVLLRTGGSWRDLATRALRVALNPDQRTPLGIENADLREYEPTQTPPTLTEYRNAPRCDHGAEVGKCFPCRATHRTEEPA